MAKTIINAVTAQKLLDNNFENNRKITKSRVEEYTTEMKKGMWIYNGESIIVSESGRLLDGQHRLLAVIKSDTEIETELVTGVPDKDEDVDTFMTINTKNRSNVDALTIDGFKTKPQHIVKLLRFKEAFDRKQLHKKSSGVKLLNHEVIELARDFTEARALRIIERAETLHKRCKTLALPFWILGVYVFQDLEGGNKFLEQVAECNTENKTDPIAAYSRLLKSYENKGGGGAINKVKWIGMFKAYKAMMDGKQIINMRIHEVSIAYPETYTEYTV